MTGFVPSKFQPELPLDKIILTSKPGDDAVPFDVCFVGAGPASLAGAIELAKLVKKDKESGGSFAEVTIAVIEKGAEVGHHTLSGAVINPRALRELFPEMKIEDFPLAGPVKGEKVLMLTEKSSYKIPTPPVMNNHGNYVGSICELVRWLAERAAELGVEVLSGFPVKALYTEDNKVTGIQIAESGLDHHGQPMANYQPPTDITARVVALGEGTRGFLTQAYRHWQKIDSDNPQIYALGVKELWRTTKPLDHIVHTMGWPLPRDVFGGSWMYPLEPNVLSLGLVVGLDYRDATLDPHVLFQKMKTHPVFRQYLDGGEMLEWGAKTIPEGGYYSLPRRMSGDGVVIMGDAAGFVDVPSLKGIHYAMMSGMLAARAIFAALKKNDLSAESLASYDQAVRESFIVKDMYKTRNMRLAFKGGFYAGGFNAMLMQLSGGRFPGGRISVEPDADVMREAGKAEAFRFDGKLTFNKVDAVYKSGNETRDSIPSHLLPAADVPGHVAELYEHLCPANVYERVDGKLRINAPNCIDCKATDILAPRWTPREGGSGPRYKRM
jgi:electron-transferring-flavoprotein dehydrogenase